jgi:adenine-specific DNA-methyltransferase
MAQRPTKIDTLTHDEATRKNAPTAELEAFVDEDMKRPIVAAYQRRNPDLDPQLVWRGKDVADWSDLVVNAPPLYIQEKIHPKAIVEDLKRASARRSEPESAPDLFADFNGIEPEQRTEFYQHDQHWSNRMILGDGLQVMASLAEREGLKGQVQCIYIDPPYGIKFNSNFQWSTTSRDVKDGKADHMSREPEQVKAFRDTWADGIHSYLTYLRDRLTVARDLLTESGSIFVQIGDENVHRVRALMDEVFGDENFVSLIVYQKTSGQTTNNLTPVCDYIVWFAKNLQQLKFRRLWIEKRESSELGTFRWVEGSNGRVRRLSDAELRSLHTVEGRIFRAADVSSQSATDIGRFTMNFEGREFQASTTRRWSTNQLGMSRLARAQYLMALPKVLTFKRYFDNFPVQPITNVWTDTIIGTFTEKLYVVQTGELPIQRCILMASDPGDLVLDPTCGSGTSAFVAEQWGRRWITIDTSRVALALARARIMGARYPWYLLADSPEGQRKEAEITRAAPKDTPTYGRIRQGFVYRRVPHITLKSIANNAEIDTIWEGYQEKLEPLRASLNAALGQGWEEWQIPREAGADWSEAARSAHAAWWQARIARQKEIDASIAAKADTEYLYDQPYEWKDRDRLSKAQEPGERWRVAGPFTVESLSPHRVPAMDVDDSLFDELEAAEGRRKNGAAGAETADFAAMVLDNLRKSGVQQRDRADRLVFESMKGWPGDFICAEGRVRQASDAEAVTPRRAAILVGPEYGTVARADLTAAAREAAEAGFDILIAAAFNFDAHAGEFEKMGRLTVLKARINPDLHMPDLANTGAGNLFTVFGEPDIQVHEETDGMVAIEVAGIDMYKGGQIEASSADDIAAWFIDTDYDYESFFVRHAYFPGQASDPYKSLRTTLKAEIDEEAWASLRRTRSRPFPRPASGRVAVKVINHLGDEVMKVMAV